ncbi:MAG: DUF5119 domain-containing protein [Methanothrix sp.]|nr:DUF5119 domain-containing protein [Methanothrix sp.]
MRKVVFVSILVFLCLSASSCRKDLYYDGTTQTVDINVLWPDTITVPEGVRAIFFPTDGSTPHVYNLSATGGSVLVPVGEYTVLLFNNDTEYARLQNTESLSTIEAYTSLLLKAGDTKSFPEQNIVNMPDMFYTYLLKDYQVLGNGTSADIEAAPKARVFDSRILVKIVGLKNVSSSRGYISGVAGSYFPGKDSLPVTSSAVAFDFGQKSSNYISAIMRIFGMSRTLPQQNIFRLSLTLINGENKYYDFNITDQLKVDLSTGLVITIADSIVVEDVYGNTGSGFNATVNDWTNTDADVPL